MKQSRESRRVSKLSGLMWWTAKNALSNNEKATLLYQDRPRSVIRESNHDGVHDRTEPKDSAEIKATETKQEKETQI